MWHVGSFDAGREEAEKSAWRLEEAGLISRLRRENYRLNRLPYELPTFLIFINIMSSRPLPHELQFNARRRDLACHNPGSFCPRQPPYRQNGDRERECQPNIASMGYILEYGEDEESYPT
jgi:hypothetical protein